MLALIAVICIAGCSTLTEVDPTISTTPQTSFNESSAVSQNEPVSFSESKTESEPTVKSTVESKDNTEEEPKTTETSRPTIQKKQIPQHRLRLLLRQSRQRRKKRRCASL